MPIAIPIIPTNEDIILAANDGDRVYPSKIQTDAGPVYLLMAQGERNRIITHRELMSIKRTKQVKTTQRKVYMIK